MKTLPPDQVIVAIAVGCILGVIAFLVSIAIDANTRSSNRQDMGL